MGISLAHDKMVYNMTEACWETMSVVISDIVATFFLYILAKNKNKKNRYIKTYIYKYLGSLSWFDLKQNSEETYKNTNDLQWLVKTILVTSIPWLCSRYLL